MKESKVYHICFLVTYLALCITMFITGRYIGNVTKTEATDSQPAFIYSDISAQTGFLNSENIMARFECVEYYIAGDKEPVKDFLIDVYRYPELDNPVSYRCDTFEEAVMFLEGLK